MAIKAKIKARALGPLYMDIWSSFLAGERDLGMDYLTKKFHTFPWFLGAQKCWWTGCCENGRPIFLAFFPLAASISHGKCQLFWNFLFGYGEGNNYTQLKVIYNCISYGKFY